jgi:hypothetical protein
MTILDDRPISRIAGLSLTKNAGLSWLATTQRHGKRRYRSLSASCGMRFTRYKMPVSILKPHGTVGRSLLSL